MRIVTIHQYVNLINKVFEENLETSFPRRGYQIIKCQLRCQGEEGSTKIG